MNTSGNGRPVCLLLARGTTFLQEDCFLAHWQDKGEHASFFSDFTDFFCFLLFSSGRMFDTRNRAPRYDQPSDTVDERPENRCPDLAVEQSGKSVVQKNVDQKPGIHWGNQSRSGGFSPGFSDNPVSLENLSHITQSNVLILLHILSHTVTDKAISSNGSCSNPPCNVLSVPMWIRKNTITFHIAIVQVFPYRIYLDKTIKTGNETRKVPLSLFSRHYEPQKILNLKLYGKISQHIAYLLYPVKITLKRPFYPYDRLSRKAYKSLLDQKERLALFFLNSDYSLYLKNKKPPPYQFYFDLGVVYETLGFYSLSDFYYKKGLSLKNKHIFVRLEHQVRSFLVYFIGINFFEEGS